MPVSLPFQGCFSPPSFAHNSNLCLPLATYNLIQKSGQWKALYAWLHYSTRTFRLLAANSSSWNAQPQTGRKPSARNIIMNLDEFRGRHDVPTDWCSTYPLEPGRHGYLEQSTRQPVCQMRTPRLKCPTSSSSHSSSSPSDDVLSTLVFSPIFCTAHSLLPPLSSPNFADNRRLCKIISFIYGSPFHLLFQLLHVAILTAVPSDLIFGDPLHSLKAAISQSRQKDPYEKQL